MAPLFDYELSPGCNSSRLSGAAERTHAAADEAAILRATAADPFRRRSRS
jgi:hypothetical protein